MSTTILLAGLLMAGPGSSDSASRCTAEAARAAADYQRCVASHQRIGHSGSACTMRPVICVDYDKYKRWSKKRDW
jgi:hypothetical protein